MGADTHIRVSEDVKERIDRRRRKDESFNDALDRIIREEEADKHEAFMEGFGAGADADRPEKIREVHERGERKERARWRAWAEGYPVTHRPGERGNENVE